MTSTKTASASLTHIRSRLLRGGRLTKFKGKVASFAPHLSELGLIASPLALAVSLTLSGALFSPGLALAGSCAPGVRALTPARVG